jgi:serine/threonine protein kinase
MHLVCRAARIKPRVLRLADNPRPIGSVKLAGATDLYRIRMGDCRVAYRVNDPKQFVEITSSRTVAKFTAACKIASEQTMPTATFTCPRCFLTAPLKPDLHFCPRCGLPEVQAASEDTAPLDIAAGRKKYQVLDRLAIGSICTIYRCRFASESPQREGVLKIARDARANDLVLNEADILRRLHAADEKNRYGPFLPAIEDSFAVADEPGSPTRQANILRMHSEIDSPDELYSLAQVKAHYPSGLDQRHIAWIWRRLLTVLAFVHAKDIVHGAILPPHILIEPREHKLLLIDWCSAMHAPGKFPRPLRIISGGHLPWYQKAETNPPTPALDIALGVRCMIELLGGDPLNAQFPATTDPALQRYFLRCLSSTSPDASQLLQDFDHLIHALWGERKFAVLALPPRTRAS